MNNTSIEWTDSSWNPIRGCSRVSEGCRNCYAEKVAYRFSGPGQPYEGLVRINAAGERQPQWSGQIQFADNHLLDPLKWKAPRRIFVNSMSDLFHEGVTDAMLDKIFAVMALAPQHTFQILTKRPARMLVYLSAAAGRLADAIEEMRFDEPRRAVGPLPHLNGGDTWFPLANVHLGVSVEGQKTADERIPMLLQAPAAVRFISAEPLLGSINFRWAKWDDWSPHPRRVKQLPAVPRNGQWLAGSTDELDGLRMLDWVIAGGESGPGTRPMHPDWARSLRDQCAAAGVPFFFKQWGQWGPCENGEVMDARDNGYSSHIFRDDSKPRSSWEEVFYVGKKAAGRLLDGREWNEMPR